MDISELRRQTEAYKARKKAEEQAQAKEVGEQVAQTVIDLAITESYLMAMAFLKLSALSPLYRYYGALYATATKAMILAREEVFAQKA